MKPTLYCGKCWSYVGPSDGPEVDYGDDYEAEIQAAIEWITCGRCLERQAAPRRVAGTHPAVCLQCRQPFGATRQSQRFCSSSCRARAWRERRVTA